MLVKECMTQEVKLADSEMSLSEAARIMRTNDCGILPVAKNGRIVGMLSDRDIVTRAVAEGKDPLITLVEEAMTSRVLYCFEEQPLEEVLRNMGEMQVRRLPVLDKQKHLVGILSLGDLAVLAPKEEYVENALHTICEREPRRSA